MTGGIRHEAPELDEARAAELPPPLPLERARVARDLRCAACGYGAVAAAEPIRCPMCGGEAWDFLEWRPFRR